MIEFRTYEEVERWARRNGMAALRDLLRCETMRSNSQSLAAIWLERHERAAAASGRRASRREGPNGADE